MLISEFAVAAGLSVDTVRFYVREGLLAPGRGRKGGLRGYHEFGPRELRIAAGIRLGRELGLSIADIKAFIAQRRAEPASREQTVAMMQAHRTRLEARVRELQGLVAHLDDKIAWMRGEAAEPVPPRAPGPATRDAAAGASQADRANASANAR